MDNFENLVFLPLQLEEHIYQEAYTSVHNGALHVNQLDRSCLSILQPFKLRKSIRYININTGQKNT